MKIRRNRWLGIPIILAVLAAGAAVVMLLWNCIIPAVIGWGALSYWQAAGLLLLCKILFGSFRKGGAGMGEPPFRRPDPRMGFMHGDREKMHEEVKNMSAEQRREYIRKHMFGGSHRGDRYHDHQ